MQPVSATGLLLRDPTPGNSGGTAAEQEALTEGHMAITPAEAARLTGLGKTTLARVIKAGRPRHT